MISVSVEVGALASGSCVIFVGMRLVGVFG
jgi:hypothetical protein